MIKLFNLITIALLVLETSSCSWKAIGMTKDSLINGTNVCELSLGKNEKLFQDSFEKVTVYTENGESYKFRGKVCDGTILVEVETNNYVINKISILDAAFCSNGVCIGMSFEEVKDHLPSAKLFFSGEEGGIFSLEGLNGIRYEFTTDGINIDCYVNQDSCTDKIQQAKLKAIII